MKLTLLCLLCALTIQCAHAGVQNRETEIIEIPAESTESWLGYYQSGDDGYFGISLQVKDGGLFKADFWTCVSDASMEGTWVTAKDWIEFFPTKVTIERGEVEGFSSLPKMKRMEYLETTILLPLGDEEILVKDNYLIDKAFSKGKLDERVAFLSKFFGW